MGLLDSRHIISLYNQRKVSGFRRFNQGLGQKPLELQATKNAHDMGQSFSKATSMLHHLLTNISNDWSRVPQHLSLSPVIPYMVLPESDA